jgi:large subunit ribosomal protein L15
MQLNDLFNIPGSKKKRVRVGRGIGCTKGKTCGRGVKGQKSRSGVAIKGFEGGQMPIIHRLPKRGFVSLKKPKYETVNVTQVYRLFESREMKKNHLINAEFLFNCRLVSSIDAKVKVIGVGGYKADFVFEVSACTVAARSSIESFGGVVNLV